MDESNPSTVNLCGITQLLMPAFLAAVAVASLTGSDPLGWVAAVVTVAVLAAYRRTRGIRASCALPVAAPHPDEARAGAPERATR